MRKCKTCSSFFVPSERWMTYCEECFEDIHKKTVPANESHHPSVVYEREHVEEESERADPAHVKSMMDELSDMFTAIFEEAPVDDKVSQTECEHKFPNPPLPHLNQCLVCEIFEEQYRYSMTVKPQAWPKRQ